MVAYFSPSFFGLPKLKPWTIVHGFWPENKNFEFGGKGNHRNGHLKRNIMAQISASYLLPVRSYEGVNTKHIAPKSRLQMFTVLICKAPSPSFLQVDMDGECGAELATLKLSWFTPVNDGEYEALMAFNVVSV